MGKSLIDKAIDSIFDAEWAGKRGERLCESELRWVRLLGRKGTVLRNAYVPKRGGGTSEIDVTMPKIWPISARSSATL